ncbi:Calcium channel YVC1 [Sphaceloma murrayae]|uniref:Calcium channel YVC1 n=1 Tax=Sphaceloma murrayae TaxID=2082308 RepID=A0A2K1QTE6_9PEZI|nr:Calcium channel YVC1 [Sphaceloma murrayae]
MLSSLLRPRRPRRRVDRSPFSSPFTGSPQDTRHEPPTRGRPEHTSEDEPDDNVDYEDDYEEIDDEDEESERALLPIFSAAHLDTIPVYTITHAIRMLITQKCETTLTWDQLRAPQVSQFLVKPIQTQIRATHFNKATLTALIANCLQFKKEVEFNPGNAGVSRTRAMLAELLAMRLLREYSTRELIDALSYDFDPLQGMDEADEVKPKRVARPRSARISTIEIAIRATAKSFLAHPLVVQQLEAVWAGSIVFHSAADNLHRKPPKVHQSVLPKQRGYGTIRDRSPLSPGTRPNGNVQLAPPVPKPEEYVRRSVTLYDPRDASLFKLSRLRVPRYRQLFSTLSFAIMLVLFLAVLTERSLHITILEIVFWIYSTGYMLDEIVGFTEQGFGLYILSVWNAFDLGILLCLIIYYGLRLVGVLVPDIDRKHTADMAYDVLASTAVLLFPRAFSVLDHYRYFSQLLIAFRMMAQDMVAILILIVISCSGFFVAFTTAFTKEDESGLNVAYALFQIVMGFSPAAWSAWDRYNPLGRVVMAFFLVICHFMIVTILITVLTNSFMAIVRNAEEEHQFLFAVNTISMVKSDALFSYIAPTNVLSWAISPLRFIMPFRRFVKLNRTVIKITHFPILFSIFAYERIILSRIAYEPTDLVDRTQPARAKPVVFGRSNAFNQRARRLREPSVVSFRKEQALDEVFRRPYKGSETVRTTAREMETDRRKSSNVVDHWMQGVGKEGGASPPMEQPRSVLDRLENRRPGMRRAMTSDKVKVGRRDYSTATRSVLSDPEDRAFFAARRPKRIEEEADPDSSSEDVPQETDAEADDELMTHDEADLITVEQSSMPPEGTPEKLHEVDTRNKENVPLSQSPADYFTTPTAYRPAEKTRSNGSNNAALRPKRHHDRTVSTNTILFQPATSRASSSSSAPRPPAKVARPGTAGKGGISTPAEPSGHRTPRQAPPATAANITRARPIVPPRQSHTIPDARTIGGFNFAQQVAGQRRAQREPSFNTLALDLASDFGDNRFGPAIVDVGGISGMPASFSEQMLREREAVRRHRDDERRRNDAEERGVVQRMVLNRMNTLEEGFREVITAVRELRERETRSGTASGAITSGGSSVDTRIDTRAPVAVGAQPRTPGPGARAKDRSVGVVTRSPKKARRGGPIARGGEGTGRRTSLPEDVATSSAENREEGGMLTSVGVMEYPRNDLENERTHATDFAEKRGADLDAEQAPSGQQVQARQAAPSAATKGKEREKEDQSPNSVKSIVETLEQKGKLQVAQQRSTSRSSSGGQPGQAVNRASATDGGRVSSGSSDGLQGLEMRASAAQADGPSEGTGQQTVGSRRPRDEGEEGKRESVIFVGKGPDLRRPRE